MFKHGFNMYCAFILVTNPKRNCSVRYVLFRKWTVSESLNFNYVSGTHIPNPRNIFRVCCGIENKRNNDRNERLPGRLLALLRVDSSEDARRYCYSCREESRPFLKRARYVGYKFCMKWMSCRFVPQQQQQRRRWCGADRNPTRSRFSSITCPCHKLNLLIFHLLPDYVPASLRSTQFGDHYNRTEPLLMDTF